MKGTKGALPSLDTEALRPAPGAWLRQVLLQTPMWTAGAPRPVWTTVGATQDRGKYNDKSCFGHMVAFQVSREDSWLLYPIVQGHPVTPEGSIGQAALDSFPPRMPDQGEQMPCSDLWPTGQATYGCHSRHLAGGHQWVQGCKNSG